MKFLLWEDPIFFRGVSGQLPSLKDSPDNFYIFFCIYFEILGPGEGGPEPTDTHQWINPCLLNGLIDFLETLHKGSTSFVDKHEVIYSVQTFPRRDKLIFKKAVGGRYHFVSMITVPLVDLVV